MDVTLRQLRAFSAVARTGSFTRAAETLYVTQSALSGLIKELEEQLGVRLLDRTTRRSQLSEVGREFHVVVARLLRGLDEAVDDIDKLKHLRRGVVRIAAPQLMASSLLPEVIARFSRHHPDVQIRLADCTVEEVIGAVVAGDVDIGIGPQRSASATLTADPFINPPLIAVFPHGHALQSLAKVRWRELMRYPLITLQGQFADQLRSDLFTTRSFPAIEPRHEVAFMSTALAMVSAGMGVSVCLPYAQSLVDLYRLETRPLVNPELRRWFFIYSRRHASLSPAADAFRQALLAHVGVDTKPARHGARQKGVRIQRPAG